MRTGFLFTHMTGKEDQGVVWTTQLKDILHHITSVKGVNVHKHSKNPSSTAPRSVFLICFIVCPPLLRGYLGTGLKGKQKSHMSWPPMRAGDARQTQQRLTCGFREVDFTVEVQTRRLFLELFHMGSFQRPRLGCRI